MQQPRWRRRKEARPGDIVAAALAVFAEKGFAGARIDEIGATALAADLPFPDVLRTLLPRFAELVATRPIGAVVKMVVGESRNFPELARVWHDEVIAKGIDLISALIRRGQARGEIRPGDPRTYAFSIMGPILIGVLWRETFTPIGGAAIDLPAVARQHVETVLEGLAQPGDDR